MIFVRKMRSSMIYRRLLVTWSTALWAVLSSLAPKIAPAQQPSVFYVIGAEDEHPNPGVPTLPLYQGIHLYEMDSATHVVRSAEIHVSSGMLTGDRKTIVLVYGGDANDSSLLLISVSDLRVYSRMDIPASEMRMDIDGESVPCLDHIFVHPVTGLTYFSCALAKGVVEQLVVDPFRRKIMRGSLPVETNATIFLYDPTHQWIYLSDPAPPILDAHNQLIGRVDGPKKLSPIQGRAAAAGITGMSLLPDGKLVLLYGVPEPAHNITGWTGSTIPTLSTYDPITRKFLHTWTEERTYTGMVVGRIHGVTYKQPTLMQFPYGIQNVPVPSRDGSRLFGIEDSDLHNEKHTEDGAILWDAKTLQVLRRWTLPEPGSYDCSTAGTGGGLIACFAPAPDGHGMWFFGKSGKIYRLDDHTGDLIEEVKLPFHLISLIREP